MCKKVRFLLFLSNCVEFQNEIVHIYLLWISYLSISHLLIILSKYDQVTNKMFTTLNYVIIFTLVIVGSKPILYPLSGPKNQSFRNKSGKTQLIWTKFGIHGLDRSRGDNIQGILGAIGPFWGKWGLGRVPGSLEFLLYRNPDNLSATSQRPIFTKFGHET